MNIKRKRHNQTVKLGRFHLTVKDVLNMEKIIAKHLNPVDMYVEMGRMKNIGVVDYAQNEYESIKKIPRKIKSARYLRLRAKPIKVTITPLQLTVAANRIYSNGKKLQAIDKTIHELKMYVRDRKRSLLNKISF